VPKSESFSCLHCKTPVPTQEDLQTPRVAPAWEETEGAPRPLGATWVVAEQAWNMAVYSRHARCVSLVLFDDDVTRPAFTLDLDPLANKSGRVWHCRVRRSECPDAKYYAWQMDGPAPAAGFDWHTFDAEKLLLDPYAKALVVRASGSARLIHRDSIPRNRRTQGRHFHRITSSMYIHVQLSYSRVPDRRANIRPTY
jgi:pullulanase/glycogen debranching enzyme